MSLKTSQQIKKILFPDFSILFAKNNLNLSTVVFFKYIVISTQESVKLKRPVLNMKN